jgi:hypothetical protein
MNEIISMCQEDIAIATKAEEELSKLPKVENFETWHTLHDGIYTRTVRLKKGEVIVGALIKVPTTLIIHGKMKLYIGNSVKEIDNFSIIVAGKGRKQIMYALEDTYITMSFHTKSTNIFDAEQEFTDDAERLVSRLETSTNHITIGDIKCQEQ